MANTKNVVKASRGFRFGGVFIQSVIEGAGVAAKPANHEKLVAFAKELGVEGVTKRTDTAEALKTMKAAAKKHLARNFIVA